MNPYETSKKIDEVLNEAVEQADQGNEVMAKDKLAEAENLLESLIKCDDHELYMSMENHVDETANVIELLLLGEVDYEGEEEA